MAKKLEILIAEPDGYSQKAITVYKNLGQVTTKKPDQKGFEKALNGADVLVVRLGVQVKGKILAGAKQLKAVATNTTGLNHVDLNECRKRGIEVISLRGHTAFLEKITSTPELTFGLILALIRKIPWAFESVKKGGWDRNRFAGNQLKGRTLGIIGLGRIGKMMARYGRAFGMRVIACDPYVSSGIMRKFGVKKANLNQVLENSDIISLHVLYTSKVDQMIKEKHFRKMKPTAVFINTARGELVNEEALVMALKMKWIAGAALDVMSGEDPKGSHLKHSSLLEYARKHENLLIVPHLGGATVEAWQATEEFLADLIVKHFSRKSVE